ncbi:unnamed protein product [Vitrella brassicaformis CCMP3155]|uniref:SAICAR synthetase n=2 Tax=Vitrella brassicaformis TaxID=1169539 RepID=A0A0G4EM70_VITBC|nr:unnamed protein product [Vitrella brassicaformis CCMP3155]|mmetsp:Transcript_27582/g.68756  ORF Transcript_27582/g.68756 Transcript_27582/m.68756 type:complete len:500 (+) Transcript_27582:155-1654(+)|eukprot:CEL97958.1 unnamed protein product [Vitrella brassicaformis CCMP3155]
MGHVMTESDTKSKIRQHLGYTLDDCLLPELGRVKKGKVRDIYMTDKNVFMVASDRVSAFDYVLPNLIPFKGQLLNKITRWAFENTSDIIPNALVTDDADPNVVIQKKMKNLNVECIVRGYLWGSMAAAYEKGERTFCGLPVQNGLLRFQQFPTPIFTPTTKAEVGHDENMTYQEVEALIGKDLAQQAKDISLKLFARGQELAAKRGLVLIDTKYEFGTDESGKLHVIDEVNTPDSSRLCDAKELETKWPQIVEAMKGGQYKDVSELLAARPELKVKEFSKQYVRDVLLEQGFKPGKAVPTLTEEQVVECVYRYINVFERITGQTFEFPASPLTPPKRLLMNLVSKKLIKGCCVGIFAGSDSDMPHLQKIQDNLTKFGVPSHIRICSAHKQPSKLEQALEYYNRSIEPMLIVGCAGGTDALSGTASYHSVFPVVSCPPDGWNESCLKNPPGSSNAYCLRPDNVAKFAAQTFSFINDEIRSTLQKGIAEKIVKLEKADNLY